MRIALAAVSLALLAAGCTRQAQVGGPRTPPPLPGHPLEPPPPQTVPASLFNLHGEITQGALLTGTVPQGTALLLLDGKPVRFVAEDGRFIIGLNRDAASSALLEARLADGRLLRLPLTVSPRQWDISNLSTLSRGTSPSPAYQRIRAAEQQQITAGKNADSDTAGWRQQFRWPTTGRISTLFGSQRIYAGGVAGAYHGGIDIARPTGTPVYAPADGVITLAASHPFSLEGNLVLIDHGFGLISAMMHLSKIEVTQGQRITRGQEIGLVGMTGRATGPHLHWGLTWKDARIDPLLVAGPMPAQ
ncbi:M23 family metallopeptidase [Sphingomonas bacterium]|uniref:M23 family metallopeptidase n=1 Tax=Sphingomonas bacterium TaxID=1895847 RepID=UPI0020C6A83D|nr:M23 family metallopeptidase [Sphingomonas bacterium]